MKKIFIVHGMTAEYEDRTDWSVMAYIDEIKAQRHVINAQCRADEIYTRCKGLYEESKHGKNEFDPNMLMDLDGTRYFVKTIDLDEEPQDED